MLKKKNGFMLLSVFLAIVSVNAYAGIAEDAKEVKQKIKQESKDAYHTTRDYIDDHKGEWNDNAKDAKEKFKEDSKNAYEKAKEDSKEAYEKAYEKARSFIKGE